MYVACVCMVCMDEWIYRVVVTSLSLSHRYHHSLKSRLALPTKMASVHRHYPSPAPPPLKKSCTWYGTLST